MYEYTYAHTDRQTIAAYMQTKKKQGGCSISDCKAFALDWLEYLSDSSAPDRQRESENIETILRIRII